MRVLNVYLMHCEIMLGVNSFCTAILQLASTWYSVGRCESCVGLLTGRCLLRPRWGRDNICVVAAGGKTPDISSDRRTFADVMTENKLKATQVNGMSIIFRAG